MDVREKLVELLRDVQILNGYSSEVTPVQMTYPYTGIKHFTLTIYCDESLDE